MRRGKDPMPAFPARKVLVRRPSGVHYSSTLGGATSLERNGGGKPPWKWNKVARRKEGHWSEDAIPKDPAVLKTLRDSELPRRSVFTKPP